MPGNDDSPVTGRRSNSDLHGFYEAAYAKGADVAFSNWSGTEADAAISEQMEWEGQKVLDIGCGVGRFARMLRAQGAAHVTALDYAEEAIRQAEAQTDDADIDFVCANVFEYSPRLKFDAVTTLGTMEHMDEPSVFLSRIASFLQPHGRIVISCPHFINIRGLVWMTLAKLLEVPMSLSDIYFIHPWDLERWAREAGLKIKGMFTVDDSRANGDRLITDFEKRLPNALRDAGLMTESVKEFNNYLGELTKFVGGDGQVSLHGATAIYELVPEAKE